MSERGKAPRAKRARLKMPLWLGALVLAGCAVWTGCKALPPNAPPSSSAAPARAFAASPQSGAPPQAASRVPLPQEVDGYPVMARLVIGSVGLELPVIAELSDAALKTAPCLYAGPSSPQDAGNIVIVGHNYNSDTHFGRLGELEAGAAVQLTDRAGELYEYEVYAMETIAPDDIDALEDYEGESGLALITCTADGRNRLLVKCRLAGDAQ